MAKTKEELETLKKEVVDLNNKLKDLSEDELNEIVGGSTIWDVATKMKEKFDKNK